jgi:GT2 family glycosyltransferase
MDYSVVILSFNSERYIGQCLDSLVGAFAALSASYEIFVIDNGSQDRSKVIVNEIKTKHQANIDLTAFDHNTGTTFSRNHGLRRCQGEKIIILDSDAYVNAEAIEHLSTRLDHSTDCGLICPKLTYPDGRFQISTDVFPTFVRKLKRFLFLKKMEASVTIEPDSAQRVDYAISAFWMLPRKVLAVVGMLDENIFYSPEDVDYCIRIWKSGLTIVYDPQVAVVHDAQEISRSKGFKINWFTLSHIKGLLYLFIKHRYFFSGKKFTVRHAHGG